MNLVILEGCRGLQVDRFVTILFENAGLESPQETREKELRRIVADNYQDLLDNEKDEKIIKTAMKDLLQDMSDNEFLQEWEITFYEKL
jgi:hypothetical protein